MWNRFVYGSIKYNSLPISIIIPQKKKGRRKEKERRRFFKEKFIIKGKKLFLVEAKLQTIGSKFIPVLNKVLIASAVKRFELNIEKQFTGLKSNRFNLEKSIVASRKIKFEKENQIFANRLNAFEDIKEIAAKKLLLRVNQDLKITAKKEIMHLLTAVDLFD